MTLRQLKWLTIGAPLAFLLAVVVTGRFLAPDLIWSWLGILALLAITLFAALGFSETVFGIIDGIQARQAKQNRELLALHEAGLEIAAELDLETVLQRVVDRAAALVGARYGALSLLAPAARDGQIAAFITTGITPEERARLGPPPRGHGLLGVVLTDGQRLRLDDLTAHPRSAGFPPGHPVMRSLLAVPIVARDEIMGNLYLTEKAGGAGFTADDEETLARFATQAALAIANARLHRLAREVAISEERARLAREMHDSLAQVLGYVNTKAQAAQEFLRQGRTDSAHHQLEQLGGAARDAYADVREQILGLRATAEPGTNGDLLDALRRYLDRWQEQSEVRVDLVAPDGALPRDLPPTAELQLLRIIQEALSNVRKHAGAGRAAITIARLPGALDVTIADDGAGFDPDALGRAAFPRFGLAGMRERAEAIGATLEVISAPGEGTRVRVRLPLRGAVREWEGERVGG
jgi:signal transduction histidine kinase